MNFPFLIKFLGLLCLAIHTTALELQFNQLPQNNQQKRSSCMVLGAHYFKSIKPQFQNLVKQFPDMKKKTRQNRVLNHLYQTCQERINQQQIQYILKVTQQQDLQTQERIFTQNFNQFYKKTSIAALLQQLQKQETQFAQQQKNKALAGKQRLQKAGEKLAGGLKKLTSQMNQVFKSLFLALNNFLNATGEIHKQGTKKIQKIKKFWDQL